MDAIVAATILLRHGIDPILQLTCRDRNPDCDCRVNWLGAAAAGISNVLILTGR